jgi:hypothetical protein
MVEEAGGDLVCITEEEAGEASMAAEEAEAEAMAMEGGAWYPGEKQV